MQVPEDIIAIRRNEQSAQLEYLVTWQNSLEFTWELADEFCQAYPRLESVFLNLLNKLLSQHLGSEEDTDHSDGEDDKKDN